MMKTAPASSPSSMESTFAELREAYESGELVIFAGPGLSVSAGLPGWKRIVELLTERARAREVAPAALQEVAELAVSRQYIDALSALEDCLGTDDFRSAFERLLDDRLIKVPEVARAIVALAPRLRAVLTTSVDRLLERAFAGRWPTLSRATADIAWRRHFILKLHGTLTEHSSLVFTRQDYERAMLSDPRLRDAFSSLFLSAPVLFVGHDLADDDFVWNLTRVRDLVGPNSPPHFALVPSGAVTPYRKKRLEALGLRLISFDASEGQHAQDAEVLMRLATPESLRTPRVPTSSRPFSPVDMLRPLMKVIERSGFSASTDTEHSRSAPDVSSRVSLLVRLMRCLDVPSTPVWLGPRAEQGRQPWSLNAVLVLPPQGGFVVALPPELAVHTELLGAMSRAFGPEGGVVRVYFLGEPTHSLSPGVEVLGWREALEPLVREPLRAHAQRCLDAWTEPDEHRFVAARARLQEHGEVLPVAEALDRGLTSHRRVLMLGDFGTGKSTHLKRSAALMARAWLEAPHQHPAPVFLPLEGQPPVLDALIERHVEGLSVEAFRLAVDVGVAMPLFDGLDELAPGAHSPGSAVAALLGSFSGERARGVLTSRKTLFPEPEDAIREVLGNVPSLAILELLDLDASEVIEFVGRRTLSDEEKARVLEGIRRTHDLTSISRRPVLLELIVRNRERLSSREMSAAQLYRLAAEDWLESRGAQERHVVREQRLAFARLLARQLFRSGTESATLEELARWIQEGLGNRAVSLDEAVLELHTAVFLAHDGKPKRFRFAHKSFLEYFLAVDISEQLDAGRAVDALDLPRLTPEVVLFLAGLEGWEQRKVVLQRVLTSAYQPRVSENALLALYFATRERVGGGEALGRALEVELPAEARLEGSRLFEVELPWVSLRGANLTGAELSGARLEFADLRRARLDRASASHTVFDGALLDGASFLEAELGMASWVDASIVGVALAGAQCEGLIDLGAEPARQGEDAAHLALPQAVLHSTLGDVTCVSWSPDGRHLVSGHSGGVLRVWDARRGVLLHRMARTRRTILAVAFLPDGQRLAAASDNGAVELWDVRSGALLFEWRCQEGSLTVAVFSPDGSRLVADAGEGMLGVWHVPGGTLLHRLRKEEGGPRAAAFSPDGLRLAVISSLARGVRVWDARSGALLHRLETELSGPWSLAFSPDGLHLAIGFGLSGVVEVWDATGAARVHRLPGLKDELNGIWTMAFSPDGQRLVTAATNGTLSVWDARQGVLLHRMEGRKPARQVVAYSPDGQWVVSVSWEKVEVWDGRNGTLVRRMEGQGNGVWGAAYSPDGLRLVTGSSQGRVAVWDTRTGKRLHQWKGHEGAVVSVVYSPDGLRVATVSHDWEVGVWDAQSGTRLHGLNNEDAAYLTVAFSPEGLRAAKVTANGRIRMWEAESGTWEYEPKQQDELVSRLVLSPDGLLLAGFSHFRTMQVWDVLSGVSLYWLKEPEHGIWPIAFSPDSSRLVGTSKDGSLGVLDARSGTLVHRLAVQGRLWPMAFSSDGSRLAGARRDGSVEVWDVQGGTLLHRLEGHRGDVTHVEFARDGHFLATTSEDGTARLFNLRDGSCLATFLGAAEGWVTHLEGTPFFTGEGNLPALLHYVSGARIMSAELWAPLFQRAELVQDSLAGRRPEMKALGLESGASCMSALLEERRRRALIRRRTVPGSPQPARRQEGPAPSFSLPLSTLTIGLRHGGQPPPVTFVLGASHLPAGTDVSVSLHQGDQQVPVRVLLLERCPEPPGAATLQLQADVAGPGSGLLAITLHSPEGPRYTSPLTISFVPENPYIVGPPIHHPKDFYGREEVLLRILRELDKGSLMLQGELRIGKTSLLHQLEHRLSGTCHFTSLEGYTGNLESLPLQLARSIAPGESQEGNPYIALSRAVAARLGDLSRSRGPGARFVLMFDEAHLLAKCAPLRSQLRALFQTHHRHGLRALLAGPKLPMRALAQDSDSEASPLLNMFQALPLGPMSREELTRLIRTPLGDEYTVTDEAVDQVFALSGGRPLIAQLLCHQALEACHSARSFRIDADGIARAFREEVFAQVIDIYGYHRRWERLPEEVRGLLCRLAELPAPERETTDRESLRRLDAHGLADMVRKRLDVEPTFFHWIQEMAS
jgi:WD40 repeat protein